MKWANVQLLLAEAFRLEGFLVKEIGGEAADMVLMKDERTYLVDCRHWRALEVGANAAGELYGAMGRLDAKGGFVVTAGKFTSDALEFARGLNVELDRRARARAQARNGQGNDLRRAAGQAARPLAEHRNRGPPPVATAVLNYTLPAYHEKCHHHAGQRDRRAGEGARRRAWMRLFPLHRRGVAPRSAQQGDIYDAAYRSWRAGKAFRSRAGAALSQARRKPMTCPVLVDASVIRARAIRATRSRSSAGGVDRLAVAAARRPHQHAGAGREFYAARHAAAEAGRGPRLGRGQALSAWTPLPTDEALLRGAREVERRYKLAWWDSMAVAAAQIQRLRHPRQRGSRRTARASAC